MIGIAALAAASFVFVGPAWAQGDGGTGGDFGTCSLAVVYSPGITIVGYPEYVATVSAQLDQLRQTFPDEMARIDWQGAQGRVARIVENDGGPNGATPLDSSAAVAQLLGTDGSVLVAGAGSSVNVLYDPNLSATYTDGTSCHDPSLAALAHELIGHGLNDLEGTNATAAALNGWDSPFGMSSPMVTAGSVNVEEQNAMNVENVVRQSLGIDLRTDYVKGDLPNGVHGEGVCSGISPDTVGTGDGATLGATSTDSSQSATLTDGDTTLTATTSDSGSFATLTSPDGSLTATSTDSFASVTSTDDGGSFDASWSDPVSTAAWVQPDDGGFSCDYSSDSSSDFGGDSGGDFGGDFGGD